MQGAEKVQQSGDKDLAGDIWQACNLLVELLRHILTDLQYTHSGCWTEVLQKLQSELNVHANNTVRQV